VELLVYRHIDAELTQPPQRHYLRYTLHRNIEQLFAPVPRGAARVLLPGGAWSPEAARKAYGGVVARFSEHGRRWWCVLSLVNVAVQVLSSIGGGDAACDAMQALTIEYVTVK
jgi:hypothetical protein